MAKANSPMRLDASLVRAASSAAVIHHRSIAEQIEYWADLGRNLASLVTPEHLLEIQNGLSTLIIEPVKSVNVNPEDVFANLERERVSGELANSVTSASTRYEASKDFPGQLEQISVDGTIIGQFNGGKFTPMLEQ